MSDLKSLFGLYVEYRNSDGSKDYARFEHLSSALDFIHSNFK